MRPFRRPADADLAAAPPIRPAGRFEPLITAEEGFPALEKLAWEAESSIWMAFRIFDPATRIRSPDVPCETWSDLLRYKLGQNVSVRIALADFCPVAAAGLHETCWRSVFALAKLADAGPIEVMPIRHEARVGRGLRYGLWLPALMQLELNRRALNALPADRRRLHFLALPGTWPYLRLGRTGRLKWRAYRLPRLYPVTHHQKIAVFDGETAVVGGLDVNERRWDDKGHNRPAADTWHDVSVIVDGPVVADVARHLARGWNECRLRMEKVRAGQRRFAPEGAADLPLPSGMLPEPATPRETARQGLRLVRTISKNSRDLFRLAPVTRCTEIENAHLRLIRSAGRLIYIESQFLRSRPIADGLAEAARERPGLGLVMIVPAAPEQIAFDKKLGLPERFGEHLHSECVEIVRSAFGERAVIASPVRHVRSDSDGRDATHGAEIVYVHSKVIVVDDREAIVSSANLNGRSLRWDQEAGIVCNIPERAAHLRRRLFEHWLSRDAGEACFGLDTAVDAWRRMLDENARTPPENRRGFLVPHDHEAAELLGMPVPGLPEELV